ncbi:MAG: glycoside hydrolase family 130 protein [Bacteroidia bacterium]|nr:glycoside hydrolase family 130 protein [Bacteroidia bacterium]
MNRSFLFLSILLLLSAACTPPATDGSQEALADTTWMMGPFVKLDSLNPILNPLDTTRFWCPVRQDIVAWEAKDVFNPAVLVRNNRVILIYRAEDTVGKHAGTSRLGMAWSLDGKQFNRLPQPFFYPGQDSLQSYEWEGGCEDPRVVEDSLGRVIMTYTAYDGQTARLMVATSRDLVTWEKHGPAFGQTPYRNTWSKSGSIVARREGSRLIATRIQGKYWMYWGDTDIFVATSSDLIHWTPVESSPGKALAALRPRPGKFDSRLVEPGPPAILTDQGIVLIYNGMNLATGGDPALAPDTYAGGQALFDPAKPDHLLDRTAVPFIRPDKPYELDGQVHRVCFLEGLAFFKNEILLYYGTADSRIAMAVAR